LLLRPMAGQKSTEGNEGNEALVFEAIEPLFS
jgi:hypothetical protein